MNLTLIGWGFIGLSVILLVFLKFLPLAKTGAVQEEPALEHLREAQVKAVERGEVRKLVLGDQLAPPGYPGLGLQALSALPFFLDPESGVDGHLTLGTSDGGLLVFARQIVQNRYRDGFSPVLHQAGVRTRLHGPTPLAFTAGILPELNASPRAHLALFGHYGPEAFLWMDAVQRKGGQALALGGSLAAQAVSYPAVEDLLIGESIFRTSHPSPENGSKLLAVEDVLRWVLILGILVAVVLKLGGLL